MPIDVARATVDRICDYETGFALAVERADSRLRAYAALRAVAADLLAIRPGGTQDPARPGVRPPIVSDVVMGPDGPFLFVTELEVDYDGLREIPAMINRRLTEAGVSDAMISCPELGGHLASLDTTPDAVVLRAFPVPGQPLPTRWMELIQDWVLGELQPTDEAFVRVLRREWRLPRDAALEQVYEAHLAGAWCDLVSGTPGDKLHSASITFGGAPHVSFAIGGRGLDARGRSARATLLREMSRELAAEAAFACIDFEPTFANIGIGLTDEGWPSHAGPPANRVAGALVDRFVPDAYWCQILGPGHLDRFDPDLGEDIGNGRIEVVMGPAATWMVDDVSREDARAAGWDVFAKLLLDEPGFDSQLAERDRIVPTGPRAPRSDDSRVDVGAVVPLLAGVTVARRPRGRRGASQSALELATWFEREPHGARPAIVTPAVTTMLEWMGSAMPDSTRGALHATTRRAVLQALADGGASGADREWMAIDWVVKRQVPSWLRIAGLSRAAEQLEASHPGRAPRDMLGVADALGQVVDVLGPALDGIDPEIDATIWRVWERVVETSGLVAAAQTGLVGVPRGVIEATELRVAEHARDSHSRAAFRAETRSLAQGTWNTAVHALAELAWHRAWAEASEIALDVLGSTAFDTHHRVMSADDPLASEDAEAVGIRTIADWMLDSGTNRVHAFDAAIDAARDCVAGEEWGRFITAQQTNLGPTAWQEALDRARESVDATVAAAPRIVARVSLVALGREAAALAARTAAVKGVAGVDDTADREEQVRTILGPTSETLGGSALRLLDRMIDLKSRAHAPAAGPAEPART